MIRDTTTLQPNYISAVLPPHIYWMSHYVIYPYRGNEYQISLFTYYALKNLTRNDGKAALSAQLEVVGKVPLDDIALIYPDRIKVYQVKYFKDDLGWAAFTGKDKDIRFERLFEAWFQWRTTYNKRIDPIIFTNTGMNTTLPPKLKLVKRHGGRGTYRLQESAYGEAIACINWYTAPTTRPSEEDIRLFLSSLKFKFHQWNLRDLEGSSLPGTPRGLIANKVKEIYRHSKPELLAVHMMWSIRRWFKEADTSRGGQQFAQPSITVHKLHDFVKDFDRQNQDEFQLLLQAQRQVFGNIETSIGGISFNRSNELEEIQEAIQRSFKNKRRLLIIEGEKGAGKSALVKIFLGNRTFRVLAFSADEMKCYGSLDAFFKNRLLMEKPIDPYQNPQTSPPNGPEKILYIDAAEKIMNTSPKCFEEMLAFYRDYFVILTCTPSCTQKHFSNRPRELYRVAPLNIEHLPQELLENSHLRIWKENGFFKSFFERPFLLKMLYFAAQDLDKHSGMNDRTLSEADSLRSLRRYIWDYWLRGIHPSQSRSRELFLFELVMIYSKMSEVDFSILGWEEARKDLITNRQKLMMMHQPLILQMQEEGILNSEGMPVHDILIEWIFFSLFDAIFEQRDNLIFFNYLRNDYTKSVLIGKKFSQWLIEMFHTCETEGRLVDFYSFVKRLFSLEYPRSSIYKDLTITFARIFCWGFLEQKIPLEQLLFDTILETKILDVDPQAFMSVLEKIYSQFDIPCEFVSIEPDKISAIITFISPKKDVNLRSLLKQIMELTLDGEKKKQYDNMLQLIFGWLILSKKTDFIDVMYEIAKRFPDILMGRTVDETTGWSVTRAIDQVFRDSDPLLFATKQCVDNVYQYNASYYRKNIRVTFNDITYYSKDKEKWIEVVLLLLTCGAHPPRVQFKEFLRFYSQKSIKERVCQALARSPRILSLEWMSFAIYAFCPMLMKTLFNKEIKMNEQQLREAVGRGIKELDSLHVENEEYEGYESECLQAEFEGLQEVIELIVQLYEGAIPNRIQEQIDWIKAQKAEDWF